MEMADDPDAPTAAILVDADGRVSGWSEGGRLLLGWSPEDVLGRPVTDLRADPAALDTDFPAPSSAPRPPGSEPSASDSPGRSGIGADGPVLVALRHRDGSTLDAVVTTHPLVGSDGGSQGRVMTVQRWDRRPVIADRAFEQCPFALGSTTPSCGSCGSTPPRAG